MSSVLQNLLHALSSLPGDIHELYDLEVGLQDVNVFVEAASLTPLGHYGQVVFRHVAHEQQDVDVSCFPVIRDREEEELATSKIR